MQYRTLLWLLCVCCAFAEYAEQNSTEESSTIEDPTRIENNSTTTTTTTTTRPENVEGTTSAQTADIPREESNLDETGKPRDKRTLNLILRGLANILGYTVSPIQLASIPNLQPTLPPLPPAPLPKALTPVTMPPWPPLPPPTAVPVPKAPAAPSVPQKETIKLTGVVNFGNNSDLLGHLVRYEDIFHGSGAPASAATPAPKPAPKAPIGPPVLIQIPNPIAPNLPPPLLPAPAPRPTQPLPLIPRKQEYQKEYRNSENLENYKVENKELRNEKDVTRVIPTGSKYKHDLYIGEPHWKKHYEDRLTELEKKQIEYAERLKQYEKQKSEPKEYADYEDATSNNRHREKEIADRDRVYAERLKEEKGQEIEGGERTDYEDHENSREIDEERVTPSYEEYSRPRQYSENYDEEPQRYKDYGEEPQATRSENTDETGERSLDYKDTPKKFDDYEDKLPVNDDSGSKSRPEEVRNSYGETLENRGQVDENISDYFDKFKNPQTGIYESERIQSSENERKGEPWWEENRKGSDVKVEENERGYTSPAPESKYEEYNLDEAPDGTNSRVSDKLEDLDENVEPTRETYIEPRSPDYSEAFGSYEPYSRRRAESEEYEDAPSTSAEPGKSVERLESDDSRSDDVNTKNEKLEVEASKEIPYDEFDLTNYKPYFAPVRYIYNPDELDKTTTKILSTYENGSQSKSEDKPKDDHEQPQRSSEEKEEEDLTPKIGLPQKLTTKNLHEGETKEFQVWPAPFDYVFDSTEQTNVAEVPSTPESKVSQYQGPTYESAYRQPQRHEDYTQGQFNGGTRQPETTDHEEYQSYPQDTKRNDVERPELQEYVQEPRSNVPYQSDDFRSEAPQDDLQRVSKEQNESEDEQRQQQQQQRKTEHFSELDDRKEQNSYPDDYLARYRYGFEDQSSHDEESPRIELQNYSPEEQEQRGYHSSESKAQGAKSQSSTAQSPPNALPTEYGSSSKESLASKPDFYYSQAEPHVYGRRFDKNAAGTEKADIEATTPTTKKLENTEKFEDPSSAHDYFGFSKDDYRLEGENKAPEASHSVESTPASTKDEESDLLTVPDPPTYKYDEKLTEFTDIPESDTEKVKVKEYRNKVATVKVSELKQLSPNGPVQLIGYTRNF